MKKSVQKVVVPVVAITGLFVAYVYQQVSILEMSYRLNDKEELVSKLSDEYRSLKYQVASLQSPNHLESRLAKNHVQMVAPHNIVIVKKVAQPDKGVMIAKNSNLVAFLDWKRWLGLENEAQAKTLEPAHNPYPLSVHRADG